MNLLLWMAAFLYLTVQTTPEGKAPREGMDKPMTEAMGRYWRVVLFMGVSIAYWIGNGTLR